MAESTVSEEEFSWSLAQALKEFSVESLKAEQVECIRRLICLREDVLAVHPTGFGKSLIYQIIPKVCLCLVLKKSKETKSFVVCVVSPLEYINFENKLKALRSWIVVYAQRPLAKEMKRTKTLKRDV